MLVKIYDAEENAYQVPESVLPRPKSPLPGSAIEGDLESQYLRLRTKLPSYPNLYGLGEHSDPLRLNRTHYSRTLWSRDSGDIPPGTNLYGET